MSTIRHFFPRSENNIVTDPTNMFRVCSYYSAFSVKHQMSSQYASSTEGFFSSVERCGSSRKNLSANYEVLTNISGKGYFAWAISPSPEQIDSIAGIKITLDGKEFEFLGPNSSKRYRLGLGAICLGNVLTLHVNYQTSHALLGLSNALGFTEGTSTYEEITNDYAVHPSMYCITPREAYAYGLPLCEFKRSLKVETKRGVYDSEDPHNINNYAACSYILES